MNLIFDENFQTIRNDISGVWMVEYNSDMSFPAMDMKGGDRVSLHSAGNKYVPITPDFTDFVLEAEFSVNYEMSKSFIILLCYRYDIETHTGECFRITHARNSEEVLFEVGTSSCNAFTPISKKSVTMDLALFHKRFPLKLEVAGRSLKAEFAGEKIQLEAGGPKAGKIALSREHFADVLSIHAFRIWSDDIAEVPAKTFTIPMSTDHIFCPIYCDCTLRDYGNCMDAELTFRGGVRDTPPGEGNYHGMRADLMEDCFFKVLTASETQTYIVHKGEIILVHDQLAPAYMWKLLHKKPDWPMTRKVRFIKPREKFDLAAGFASYMDNCTKELAQTPSETVFDLEGNVLSSGIGITEGKILVEFLSQKNKDFVSRIPKDDPRYDMAVSYLGNNHYFVEGEKTEFSIQLTSSSLLPREYLVELEDVYFHKLGKLKYKKAVSKVKIGVKEYSRTVLTVSMGKKSLAPGVYHLRVTGIDPVAAPLMEYCAFEVQSKDPKAPAPPVISGLPYMYNARTEWRGLETDGFEVWKGKSVNQPHYLSCAIFQPPAARKYKVMPTVRAYGRENFLWLGSRNCDDFSIEGNKDLIAEADYINVAEQKERSSLLWVYSYQTWRLEKFIEYAKSLNDPDFDFALLEQKLEETRKATGGNFFSGGTGVMIDKGNFLVMARKYWYGWVRFINDEFAKKEVAFLEELRKINPRIKYSEYGPFHVYAAKLKGPEAVDFVITGSTPKDIMGFWQFEDYPYACGYDIERGAYTMTGCMMKLPGQMMCPEIYVGGGLAGCPDGAVFYAHPPFGYRPYKTIHPKRMIRQVFEFALASGHLMEDGFHFWDRPGFQTDGFYQAWFEALLTGWRQVHDYPPAKPLASAAYIYSEESRKAAKTIVRSGFGAKVPVEEASIMDVTWSATEDVPYSYLLARKDHQIAGFQMFMENMAKLDPADCKLLVLPPLKGVSGEYLDAVRKLHKKGVNLLAFEDVSGLEDLFGVENTSTFTEVGYVKGCGKYDIGVTETCFNPLCGGTYKNKSAKVLVDGAIPVLLCKDNGKAKAAFCNIPPHMVRLDELHERMTYGKDSISKVMNSAIARIQAELTAGCEVHADDGRMIAYRSKNGYDVVILLNHDEENAITPTLTVAKTAKRKNFVSCDKPCNVLKSSGKEFQIQVRIEPGETAIFLFNSSASAQR